MRSYGYKNQENKAGILQVVGLTDLQQKTPIVAHKRELSFICLDQSGTKCATAGILGTLVRVWKIGSSKTELLYELRRGTDPAKIYSFSFASLGVINSGKLLVASSDKGTVHVWKTSGDSHLSKNTADKIREQAKRSSSENLVKDLAQGATSLFSQNERRSTCSFALSDEKTASLVKLIVPSMDKSKLDFQQTTAPTSSNLNAIVLTKNGEIFKYHIDIRKNISRKLSKENMISHTFSSSFS